VGSVNILADRVNALQMYSTLNGVDLKRPGDKKKHEE
jgi:hypothetical protein